MISLGVFANPNTVIYTNDHYDKNHNLIHPDKLFLIKALKMYQDGYYQSALTSFKKAAAFGNADALSYVGLMHIKSLGGLERDWARGYAWIKLAAQDQTQKHKELNDKIYSLLTEQELIKTETDFKELEKDYELSATIERREKWSRRIKFKKTLGSRTGSSTGNVVVWDSIDDYKRSNIAIDFNEAKFKIMDIFINDFNFGDIESGEIVPISESKEEL